ncbi:hypothetical protein MNV49_001339 [Pseudohyphozyma bogoriensis]|nr:hypothetical protein MNV49_001339 [Pseudohyphozyma bogoriensis]
MDSSSYVVHASYALDQPASTTTSSSRSTLATTTQPSPPTSSCQSENSAVEASRERVEDEPEDDSGLSWQENVLAACVAFLEADPRPRTFRQLVELSGYTYSRDGLKRFRSYVDQSIAPETSPIVFDCSAATVARAKELGGETKGRQASKAVVLAPSGVVQHWKESKTGIEGRAGGGMGTSGKRGLVNDVEQSQRQVRARTTEDVDSSISGEPLVDSLVNLLVMEEESSNRFLKSLERGNGQYGEEGMSKVMCLVFKSVLKKVKGELGKE